MKRCMLYGVFGMEDKHFSIFPTHPLPKDDPLTSQTTPISPLPLKKKLSLSFLKKIQLQNFLSFSSTLYPYTPHTILSQKNNLSLFLNNIFNFQNFFFHPYLRSSPTHPPTHSYKPPFPLKKNIITLFWKNILKFKNDLS